MGVTICFVCADERVAELGAEGSWASDNYVFKLSLGPAYGASGADSAD